MAASYLALVAKARAANLRRAARLVHPDTAVAVAESVVGVVAAAAAIPSAPLVAEGAAISAMRVGYCEGEVMMVTYAWFLALERSILGPPISTFSMHISKVSPSATHCSKG